MHVSSYRSFGDELQKIAGVSLDADTRANMAGRAGLRPGIEYLPGGELPSNDPSQTNFVPKLAEENLENRTYEKYKEYREPAKAALKGGFAGGFLGNLAGGTKMSKNPIRAGALIGSGIGIADWIASGKARKFISGKAKTAMGGSDTFSPARSLQQSGAVGNFQDKIIHKGSRLRPMKMGQKFSIPSDPAQ